VSNSNWKVILATVVIFGAGAFTGGFLARQGEHWRPRDFRRPPPAAASLAPQGNPLPSPLAPRPPRVPDVLSRQFLQQLDEELRLLPEQHEAIQKIIGEGQNLMHKTVLDARLEIREVLAPGQQRQFDGLVKRPVRKPFFGTNATVNLPPATNSPAAGAP